MAHVLDAAQQGRQPVPATDAAVKITELTRRHLQMLEPSIDQNQEELRARLRAQLNTPHTLMRSIASVLRPLTPEHVVLALVGAQLHGKLFSHGSHLESQAHHLEAAAEQCKSSVMAACAGALPAWAVYNAQVHTGQLARIRGDAFKANYNLGSKVPCVHQDGYTLTGGRVMEHVQLGESGGLGEPGTWFQMGSGADALSVLVRGPLYADRALLVKGSPWWHSAYMTPYGKDWVSGVVSLTSTSVHAADLVEPAAPPDLSDPEVLGQVIPELNMTVGEVLEDWSKGKLVLEATGGEIWLSNPAAEPSLAPSAARALLRVASLEHVPAKLTELHSTASRADLWDYSREVFPSMDSAFNETHARLMLVKLGTALGMTAAAAVSTVSGIMGGAALTPTQAAQLAAAAARAAAAAARLEAGGLPAADLLAALGAASPADLPVIVPGMVDRARRGLPGAAEALQLALVLARGEGAFNAASDRTKAAASIMSAGGLLQSKERKSKKRKVWG